MVEKLEYKNENTISTTYLCFRYHKITNMYKCLHFHKKITIEVSYNNDVSLQNALSLVSNLTLNVLTRFFHSTLGFSKTKLILTELNNFNTVRFKQFYK